MDESVFYERLRRLGVSEVRRMLAEHDVAFFNREHEVQRWLDAALAEADALAAARAAELEDRREGRRNQLIIIGIITASITAIAVAIIGKCL